MAPSLNMKYVDLLREFFFSDERTSKLSKNIFYSFFIKGYAMLIQFALVPITLNYLDAFHYGIWLVLASILEWFSYFDIGIGHGLRNKLSEALANKDIKLAKILTSTSYALVTLIFSGFILIFTIVNPLLDWGAILNVSSQEGLELSELVYFVFIFFCIRFIVSLITPIIFAYQDPAISNFMGPLGSTLSLIAIIVLSKFVTGSLFWIAIIFSVIPLLVMVAFSMVLFARRYREVIPNIRYVNFSYSKKLLGLGIGFFIIHMAMLILFSSANIILTQLFGPEEVTVYNIAYRYFTIAILVNGIITLPYWSSFTEAYYKKDFDWVKAAIKKLTLISFFLVAGLLLSLLVADKLICLWVGGAIVVPLLMKVTLTIHVAIQLLMAPFNIFINGVSKIRLQLYMALLSIVITIPLAIVFAKTLAFGPSGVVMAMICSTLPSGILWWVQYRKIINGKAEGIWNV
jgi:O-antigen/teichoic acid export membrane protein